MENPELLVDVSVEEDTAKVSVAPVEVLMQGCTFTWDDKTKAPVLSDITIELVPRALHMVVGSVASVSAVLCLASRFVSAVIDTLYMAGKIQSADVDFGGDCAGGRNAQGQGA